jgi:hypothetical protein
MRAVLARRGKIDLLLGIFSAFSFLRHLPNEGFEKLRRSLNGFPARQRCEFQRK